MTKFIENSELSVSITVDEDSEISFEVDDSYDFSDSDRKVAIIKWLLKELDIIKQEYNYLFCYCYRGDGNLAKRKRGCIKLGFIPIGRTSDKMEWHKI